jgi:hypothetical protein
MSLEIYKKKIGRKSYKEVNMENELRPIIEEMIRKNPSLEGTFKSATTPDELKQMYYQYTAETVEPIPANGETQTQTTDSNQTLGKEVEEDGFNKDEDYIPAENPDPLNEREPILYKYTTSGSGSLEKNPLEDTGKSEFEEPMNFDEAFTIPEEEEEASGSTNSGGGFGGGGNNNGGGSERAQRPSSNYEEPRFNPDFDNMSSAKKRKSTRKFAKYIVETVCMLSEKGFVWYANKDINDAKLAEYELTGEIDLTLILSLENGAETTVKGFFQMQARKAEELAVIDGESKEDLIDSLFEVLLEKGIAPTPAQELMLVAGKILANQAISLLSLSAQTNSVLAQLRIMKREEDETEEVPYQEPSYFDQTKSTAQQQQQQQQQQKQTPESIKEDIVETLLSDSTEVATTKE